MRRTTVYDVAERAGVSTATVSFTFRRPDIVRPETRERVLAAAKELDYVPNANARGLARGQTGVLGLYSFDMLIDRPLDDEGDFAAREEDIPHLDEGDGPSVLAYPLYVDEVQRGFELESWHRGRNVLLGTTALTGAGEDIMEVAGRVDGLAVFPSRYSDMLPFRTLCRNIPVVRLSQGAVEDPLACITCDNESGIRQIVEHLILVHDVRRVEFIGDCSNYDTCSRFAALCKYLHDRGLEVPTRPLDDNSMANADVRLVGLCEAIENGRLPQALVCANDQTAFEVIQVLRDAGLDIPHDVIVTGFDGVLASRVMSPSLTTVRQPMEAMGRLAARLLDEQAGIPWETNKCYQVPVRLLVRESCGCC
ncbi:LacI family DNA-binding transcriptional regulator [Bifidobacterium sp. 82T25]|nr:LacI family DNA-binding transcriptional regulator [Bifidobacterium miconisargentati]